MSFKMKIHFLFSFLLIVHNVYAGAFNITEILNKFPDYSTFNDYLTKSNVSGAINSQGTVTVLAVSNSNVGPLSGKTGDDLTAILSVHAILDYFDVRKLKSMQKASTATTLYQQTGKARGQQGFLNVTVSSTGEVLFSSAAPGSGTGAKLIGLVSAQPYNIAVLQVGGVITPGSATSAATNASTTTPPSSSPPTPAPASSPGKTPIPVPTPGKSPETSPAASPPSPPAPTPAKTPGPAPSNASSPDEAPAPSTAPAPSNASTPSPSLSPTLAPGPGPDAADNPHSQGTHLGDNLGAMSAIILSNVWLFAMF